MKQLLCSNKRTKDIPTNDNDKSNNTNSSAENDKSGPKQRKFDEKKLS